MSDLYPILDRQISQAGNAGLLALSGRSTRPSELRRTILEEWTFGLARLKDAARALGA